MNIITCEKINKVFTERELFQEADFHLQEGDKAGIVGINGTGKSTLLRMIAGLEEADAGKVILANHLVVGYLPQHPSFTDEETVLEGVMRQGSISALSATKIASSAGETEVLSGERVLGEMESKEKTDLETAAKQMLTRLGITDFTQKASELSGGQQKRLALAAVLLHSVDVLLLDEPTNHLDQEMASWLEGELKRFRGSILMVTHDRYFLDSVCNLIVEVDKGKIYTYETNYSGYLELRTQREEYSAASDRKRHALLRKELAWVQRGARARGTKQKFRLNRYEELQALHDTVYDSQVEMGSVATRMGRTTIELDRIGMSYGDKKLIQDLTYIFLKNDRIGIVGPNGCGKTTLLKLISQRLVPTQGTVTIGQTIRIGYYSQMIEDAQAPMDPEQRLIDYIKETAEYIETEDGKISATMMLEKFLFLPSAQYSPLGNLSGGEKRRVNLLRVLMEAPNVLILDEPTNDLDITTLQVLEDYLDHFKGIVIIVSHDRYFLDRCVSRILAFEEGGRIRQYEGNYTDYRKKVMMEKDDETAGASAQSSAGDRDAETDKNAWKKQSAALRKRKFTYQEQKDYESIEGEIAALEEKISALDAQMLTCTSDFVKLNELTGEKEAAQRLLDEKMERWMYLEELAQEIKEQQ